MNKRIHFTLIKLARLIGVFSLAVLLSSCQSNQPTPDRFFFPTATPGGFSSSSVGAAEPTREYIISDMPRCPGMEKIDVLKFDWPDIENALEKLADYNWGYYRCSMTQPELSKLYRADMRKPPYLWQEVNHAEHNNGIVVLYYQSVKVTWNYLWMLPGRDSATSNLVIARSNPGEPQAWECRLMPSRLLFRAWRRG